MKQNWQILKNARKLSRKLSRDNVAALSAGTFIVVIISIGIGMAFFTVLPGFVADATAALPATTIGNTTGTILNLVPFVVGALFIVYPLVFLATELKRTTME